MGTSLQVEPFSNLIDETKMITPRLLINRASVGPFRLKNSSFRKDYELLGDLVDSVTKLVDKLGWKEDLQKLIDSSELKLDDDPIIETQAPTKCDLGNYYSTALS